MTVTATARRLGWFALLVMSASCGRAPVMNRVAAGAGRGFNVLLVTIDTLRADRVGAYGSTLGLTPAIDRLAQEGIRFSTVRAHVPLTLPSHATLLTGRYPTGTGLHDNAGGRLGQSVPTLASTLKSAGYRTGAFVGSFVLDARFGLNSGFDLYDDRMFGRGSALEVVQRTAEEVLAPASNWITGEPGQHPQAGTPWFAWVHLYDPHEPYEPPEPYRSRYASDLYAGEIAYADSALDRFFGRLRSVGALERTIVVVTSDHGESLGEHGEQTHGLFAYDSTLLVPLIIWSRALRSEVVATPVRLVDVMPSILALVGVAAPAGNGRSFLMSLGTGAADPPPSYFEALNANLTRDWAPLKGVTADGFKLVDLPIPELYDLAADPHEAHNVYASRREQARALETVLDRITTSSAVAPAAAVDPDAAARLRSLGYVVGAKSKPARAYTVADDPKRLVHLQVALDRAVAEWSRGSTAQAIDTLRAVVRERPDLTVAYDRLAFILRADGRTQEAVVLLDEAARRGHADPALLRSLASMLRETGDLARSASILEALVKQDDTDLQSMDALGQTYARQKRAREAEAMLRRVLNASPNAASTWTNLGVLFLTQGRDDDAIESLSRAVAIDPSLAGAHNTLGVAYARRGDATRAAAEWREALRIRPDLEEARANLQRVGAR